MKKSKTFKNIAIVIINLVLSIILGVVLLTASYALPNENIKSNVQKSATIFKEEGKYPSLFDWCQSELDNFTDALMFNTASYEYDATPLEKAIMAYKGDIKDISPDKELVKHFIDGVDYTGKET